MTDSTTTAATPFTGPDRRRTPHRPTNWRVVVIGYLVALAFGSAYALFIRSFGDWHTGAPWERILMMDIYRNAPHPAFMLLVDAAPWAGTNLTLFPVALLIALWLWFKRRRRDLATWLMVAELGCLSHNWLLKHLFVRERPDLWERVGWYGWAAYPSGHAMASIAVLGTMAFMIERELGWRWPLLVVLSIALLNAYGRLLHGVHWPSDVLGGAAVGLIWLLFSAVGFDGLPKRRHTDRPAARAAASAG